MPHLKRGAIRDFLNIMEAHGYYDDNRWNRSDFTYEFETGSKLEFFSADSSDKVRGPRRNGDLFLNECNNLPYETHVQLSIRTLGDIYLDFNPVSEFWYHEEILNKQDHDFLIITYKDNEGLPEVIVKEIESRKGNKTFWRVYGEGLLGESEGRIFTGWQTIDTIPHEARLERYGLDFGYTNDPTALIGIYYFNGGYILDEIAYTRGLSNKQIADIIAAQPRRALTIADSAEPKSIDEIRSYGVMIQPTTKGPGSVLQRIQMMQDQRISVTKQSVNVLKEYRNYLWETDKDGRIINEPEHIWSHCFAPETLVHTSKGRIRIDELVGKTGYLYTVDGKLARFHDVKATRSNADVLSITFNDGDTLTVTPDHLLLKPNGEWIEAQLLSPSDMIQSCTYDTANIQRSHFLQVWRQQILQGLREWKALLAASLRLDNRKGSDTEASSYPSQGRKSGKQSHKQPGASAQSKALIGTHDIGTPREATQVGRHHPTLSEQVAWVKRGARVSQVTWKEVVAKPKTLRQRMSSLSYNFFNPTPGSLLWSKLQQESPAKTIARIERGRRDVTYNLEVEGTHCLLANGVIAHNSMDAAMYAMASLVPMIKRQELINALPQFPKKTLINKAR